MGIKTSKCSTIYHDFISEKPPHHMGIKTERKAHSLSFLRALKNLPTTWGLRRNKFRLFFGQLQL